jgi:RNA polymerase sigma factor (sigma-70 family)
MATAPDTLSPALERLLQKFPGTLRRVCWRYHLTGVEVDELVQEVRIRLWHAHGRQERANEHIEAIPASYLHRTALSAAVDLLRRRRARRADRMVPIDDEPEGMLESPGPDQSLADSELAERVERAIQTIQPTRRAVVVRMHLMGHPRDERPLSNRRGAAVLRA